MNEVFMIVFTAVIAISAVVYTIVTFKLWKATMASVDVAKASVLMNYLATLAQEIEKIKESNRQEALLLQQVAMLLAETAMERFLEDINFSKQPHVRDAVNKLDGLLRAQGIDPQAIPWFRPVTEKLKASR